MTLEIARLILASPNMYTIQQKLDAIKFLALSWARR